ncbi:MAG: hypothetical protein N3F66_13495 [Spirochaetes bacterium]|nr:hypothetical protein [Spirochaetota bacterium]
MKRKVFFIAIVLFIITSLTYSMDEKKGLIYQTFKAYPGKPSDEFTLLYPLEVTGPGKLRVYVQVTKASPKTPVRVTLVDVRAFDKVDPNLWEKWIQIEDKYVPSIVMLRAKYLKSLFDNLKYNVKKVLGKKDNPPKWYHGSDNAFLNNNARLEHIIDDKERLEVEGKYVVIVENENNSEIEGTILIDFPGEMFEVERSLWEQDANKPDLLVKDISLARGNRIVVTLDKDKGWMPDALWKQTGDKAVILRITAGDKVVEAKLPEFDPKRNLKYGEVNYTVPDITVAEETNVTVFIDATNQIAERSKANNKKTVTLNPKEQQGGARQK